MSVPGVLILRSPATPGQTPEQAAQKEPKHREQKKQAGHCRPLHSQRQCQDSPLARQPGAYMAALAPYLEKGAGIFQLPCPENSYLGMKRWGMTREQYDTPAFRAHCRDILKSPVNQIQNLVQNGCVIETVVGMDKSPNCGANQTCVGFSGGEICETVLDGQMADLRYIPEKGLFFQILDQMLKACGINVRFTGISE